ncbi:hypothetical protein [Argonema galeatum]|uniref:hypothetical protein n=1 Tax=Argonema galeatum TaxID=2942762 RepID=UPI002011562F|nr:hypothetical protein [Argonema galeatum]MCL1463450.1 hypothetical protein [Argonema galeatum A003/A1]
MRYGIELRKENTRPIARLTGLHSTVGWTRLFMTLYYVSKNGSDTANNGLSSETPLATVQAALNKAVAGDTVALRGGDTFRETVKPISSGTAGKPITITSYGTGRATISGLDAVSGKWETYAGKIVKSAIAPNGNLGLGRSQVFITDGGTRKMLIEARWPKVPPAKSLGDLESFKDYAISDSGSFRIDSGNVVEGVSNCTFAHNFDWNTTNDAVCLWGLKTNHTNYGSSGNKFVNNTIMGVVFLVERSDYSQGGTELRNNIAYSYSYGGNPSNVPSGLTLTNNLFVNNSLASNLSGDPGCVSLENYNPLLRNESQCVNSGCEVAPISTSSHIGAFETELKYALKGPAPVAVVDYAAMTSPIKVEVDNANCTDKQVVSFGRLSCVTPVSPGSGSVIKVTNPDGEIYSLKV